MKILVIAAHPDDEVYGMGGTMAKLADEGHEVHVLIVTDGCSTQYANVPNLAALIERKKDEAVSANKLLGVAAIHFGELPDMKLDSVSHVKLNRVVEKAVDEIQPDAVYTHFYGDVNLDHQMVFRSTLVAVRPTPGQCVKELYCYRVPSSTEWNVQLPSTAFLPNVMVETEHYFEKKLQAILAYQMEQRPYPHPRSTQYIMENDCTCGLQWGMKKSEAFMLLRKKVCFFEGIK